MDDVKQNKAWLISSIITCVVLFGLIIIGIAYYSAVYSMLSSSLLFPYLLPYIITFMVFTLCTAIQALTAQYKTVAIIKCTLSESTAIWASVYCGILPGALIPRGFISFAFYAQIIIVGVSAAIEIINAPASGVKAARQRSVGIILSALAIVFVCATPFIFYGANSLAAKATYDYGYKNSYENVISFASRDKEDIEYVVINGSINDNRSKIEYFELNFPEAEKTVKRDVLAEKIENGDPVQIKRSQVDRNKKYQIIVFNLQSDEDVLCVIPEANLLLYIAPVDFFSEEYYMSIDSSSFSMYI